MYPTFFRPKRNHPTAKPKMIAAEIPIPTPAFAPVLSPPGTDLVVARPDIEVVEDEADVVLTVDEVGDSFMETSELVNITLLLLDCGCNPPGNEMLNGWLFAKLENAPGGKRFIKNIGDSTRLFFVCTFHTKEVALGARLALMVSAQ